MMDIPPTRSQQLANRLIRHAARVMPGSLSHWAQGMCNAMAYVTSDREAVRWAIGCLGAAVANRQA